MAGTAGPELFGPLPAWETALFVDAEFLGVPVGFVSVFGVGILLPLTE